MRYLTITIATLLFSINGCVVAQRGTTQVKWEPGQQSRVIPALESGNYALLKGTDYKPQFIVHVQAGDQIGFERDGNQLVAIYGSHRTTLDSVDARYYWNYRGK
jgi:hypothetical protein